LTVFARRWTVGLFVGRDRVESQGEAMASRAARRKRDAIKSSVRGRHMSENTMTVTPLRGKGDPVRGQYQRFMLIPVMKDHAKWFDAGPVAFAVEARVIAMPGTTDEIVERGATIHVFNSDRETEYARFDSFEPTPHYHYILNGPQHNVVWGYDPLVNGPMAAWAVNLLRTRLPNILQAVDAIELAEQVQKEGFDTSVLGEVEKAMAEAWASTFPGLDMVEEGAAWAARWKKIHPQFGVY
jgi:hypothetical protein